MLADVKHALPLTIRYRQPVGRQLLLNREEANPGRGVREPERKRSRPYNTRNGEVIIFYEKESLQHMDNFRRRLWGKSSANEYYVYR